MNLEKSTPQNHVALDWRTRRLQQWQNIEQQTYEVVVIGGGITGSGIVRELALRGLRPLLIEMGDFASKTSSRTGKLIHGGVRYLKYFQFRLVFESCQERYHLLNQVASHLVKPVEFIYPFFAGSHTPKWLVAIGLFLYDVLSLFRNIRPFSFLSAEQLTKKIPNIKTPNQGALSFYDCSCNDARLVLDTLTSAKEAGAELINYAKVTAIQYDDAARYYTVTVVDTLNDDADEGDRKLDGTMPKTYRIRCQKLVNATGVYADRLLQLAGAKSFFNLTITSGIHLFFPPGRFPVPCTVSLESIDDHRPLYIVPWQHFVLVGTTDRFYSVLEERPEITKDDVDYLLRSLNYYFPEARLTYRDIQSMSIGLRPLIGSNQGQKESQISRDYEIKMAFPGFLSITGGKLTTYRRMACKAVDVLLAKESPQEQAPSRSLTPLRQKQGITLADLTRTFHISDESAQILLERYGPHAPRVLQYAFTSPQSPTISPQKITRIAPHLPYLWAEIDYFIYEEAAQNMGDICCRRTEIFYIDPFLSGGLGEKISLYMADIMRKSEHWAIRECHNYRQTVEFLFKNITSFR